MFEGSDPVIVALLALAVADREAKAGSDDTRKTEVILRDAGLSNAEISFLTGKSYVAVAKTLSRAKARS